MQRTYPVQHLQISLSQQSTSCYFFTQSRIYTSQLSLKMQSCPCNIKCSEFALRSTPPIAYLSYGAHRQLFTCFTDHTANHLFAKRSTPPIVHLPNGAHRQLFICVTEVLKLLKYVSQRMIRLGQVRLGWGSWGGYVRIVANTGEPSLL